MIDSRSISGIAAHYWQPNKKHLHRILAPVRRSGASRAPANPFTLCRSQAAQTGGDIVQYSTDLTPYQPWDGTRTGGGSCYAKFGGSGKMIRNRSPPGVCWLTVRAGSGILKVRPTGSGRGLFCVTCICARVHPQAQRFTVRISLQRIFEKMEHLLILTF